MIEVLPRSAGGSRQVDLKAVPMLTHDFTPLFKLEHLLKDVGLALDTGHELGLPFPAAAAAGELLTAGVGRGLGEQDFAAVVSVLEDLAGISARRLNVAPRTSVVCLIAAAQAWLAHADRVAGA